MRFQERDPYQWRSWFAWYPVRVSGWLVWLEWIERRRHADDTV
jgi:hypothetical protein